jgi:hypothetical protein
MVIGGQAVLLHGEPRLTRDVDITVGLDLDGLPHLLRTIDSSGLVVLVDPEEFTRKTMVLPCRDPESGTRVDFILSSSSYERLALERTRQMPIGRASVRFASAEDLVIHKIIAGRPRDLEDARSVLIKNPVLDRRLVRQTLEEFQEALAERFVERFDGLCREADGRG